MSARAAPRWGVVATIKAPTADTLAFAAHHVELGAHRVHIYLDDPDPVATAHLKAHPKTRVLTCDDAHWRRLGKPRPKKHQVRQVLNATHAYDRPAEVDWLAHIDADEFLWPRDSVAAALAALPPEALCARVRPIESLAGDGTLFKGFIPPGPDRAAIVASLYPRFGASVTGGFLSHVAGKLFLRTGQEQIAFRIHTAFHGDRKIDAEFPLPQVDLCHRHVRGWDSWIATYRYRVTSGAYRAGLGDGALHRLLRDLERDSGTSGLRTFFDELCADTPALRDRLSRAGLLCHRKLDLAAKRARHFPDFHPE